MADTLSLPAAANPRPVPYRPSWLDRLTAAVERAPGPAWAVYLALAAVLLGLEVAAMLADGTWPGHITLYQFVLALTGITFVAEMHGLDAVAARALAAFRPCLTVDDATFARLQYELVTLPAGATLAWSAASCAGSLLILAASPSALYAELGVWLSPLSMAVQLPLWLLAWWVNGALVYHTLHQLGLISRILSRHTQIELFGLQPLYAFSGVTALTGGAFVVQAYIWISALPGVLSGAQAPLAAGVLLFNIMLGGSTFVLPLWGVHRLIAAEKAAWRAVLAARTRAVFVALGAPVGGTPPAAPAELKDTLEVLAAAETRLDRVSTWPWQGAQVRGLASAVILPILLWLVTRLLERYILP